MSETIRSIELQKEQIDRLAEVRAQELVQEMRSGGGGGGSGGGLEPRVAKLEAHVEHILSGINDLKSASQALRTDTTHQKETLATLSERISHLPTKENLGTSLRNWVVGVGGILTLINVAIIILARVFGPAS